jgi:superfamily II DNA or RNA helicase
MSSSTYIGQKGYTIFKECLSIQEQNYIRETLSVKPFVPKSPVQPPSFPVYRESQKKMYLPRYFGVETYGEADEFKINDGEKINIEFNGSLRPYQNSIVNSYLNAINDKTGGGGLIEVGCGAGKCHGKDTPILMYDGSIKMVQDIKVGELLMGDDSTPRTVLSLARGREMMYKINQENGESYTVNESHILSLKDNDTIIDIPLNKYLLCNSEDKYKNYKGYKTAVEFNELPIDTDPYVVGKYIDVNKCIPYNYKCNTKEIRLKVLAGIIDTKGILDRYYQALHPVSTKYLMIQTGKKITDDIVYLSRSLGLYVKYKNVSGDVFMIWLHGNLDEIPTKEYDLKNMDTFNIKDTGNNTQHHIKNLTTNISVEKVDIDDYYGFELDGNHRYLLGDFTVTHNTVCALNIISKIKQKTLIIVHKGFLLNQWIERIEQFLPTAKVGKIQGQIIDIKDKDIVIGMLQSLSMKEYPSDMFDCFGLTVIDECHHISSEVFSRSLLKVVTKYTLGLSATMQRKDGLTKVFKMFLGDIVFSQQREPDESVLVKAIEYQTTDDDFNETVYDYRGNPQYSTMISKLCEYNRRSEFILDVIKKELQEKKEQQIMILGQNKSILIYLHKAIEHRRIASVGYYVGGMKEEDLKESEGKQIIIATYAMAAEGLDIKTLSTLLLVTPRTDVVQAVGRILRVKHERPLVIDIIDSHDVFQNQWKKRLVFYKKNKYKIIQTTSDNYKINKWEELKYSCKSKKNTSEIKELGKHSGKCLIDIS